MISTTRIILIWVILVTSLRAHSQSSPAGASIISENWLILAKNTKTGFNYYFTTGRLWKKDSINTCQVKLNIDSISLARLYPAWKAKGYDFTLFNVLLDCKQGTMKVIGFTHYKKNGMPITLPAENKSLFNLEEAKESVVNNVCKLKKYTPVDQNGPSPF